MFEQGSLKSTFHCSYSLILARKSVAEDFFCFVLCVNFATLGKCTVPNGKIWRRK